MATGYFPKQHFPCLSHQKSFLLCSEQILDAGAKDRLSRLALVKKEKARSVEDSLIKAAMSGKLPGKVYLT